MEQEVGIFTWWEKFLSNDRGQEVIFFSRIKKFYLQLAENKIKIRHTIRRCMVKQNENSMIINKWANGGVLLK